MCARIDQSQYSIIELERRGLKLQARREVFPRQQLGFLRQPAPGQKTEALAGYWGLVPAYATEINNKASTFNARAETVDQLPTFREAFKHRRAVIPMDGFYEHADKTSGKALLMGICGLQPGPLWAAGLWEYNERLQHLSVTMITTEPNSLISQVHSRMPVLLTAEDVPAWLATGGKQLLGPSSQRLAMLAMTTKPSWDQVRANQGKLDETKAWALTQEGVHGMGKPGPQQG